MDPAKIEVHFNVESHRLAVWMEQPKTLMIISYTFVFYSLYYSSPQLVVATIFQSTSIALLLHASVATWFHACN